MTVVSAPFAAIYKFNTLNSIPDARFKVHLHPNPNILDLEFPWFSFTEDTQTFLHACCCYAPRVAHTYAAADFAPYWILYKDLVMYNIFAPIKFAEYRWLLRNRMGLAREWEDLTEKERNLYRMEACACWPCYAYQEAKQVDTAMGISISCCCQLTDVLAEEEEARAEGLGILNGPRASAVLAQAGGAIGQRSSGGPAAMGPGGVGALVKASGGIDDSAPQALTSENIQILEDMTTAPHIGQRLPDDAQSLTSKGRKT